MKKQVYKFRAECMYDVVKLIERIHFNYEIKIKRGYHPDVLVEIKTNHPLDSITSILKSIPDSHVMQETIQPKHLYAGNRL